MSEYVGVVTAVGQQKLAAAIGGTALNLTTIRVGDGNGAAIAPHIGMTDLVRRVGAAYPIISSGRDPVNLTHWRVTALIPAEDGPFDIREIGVFDAAGDMIAIARHVLVEKRSPAQGAAVELTTDIVFPVSETARVTVQVTPAAQISIFQMLRAGFTVVESASLANPPANAAPGRCHVVPEGASGAWNGLAGMLVQWNGTVWVAVNVPSGFLVVAQDRALDHAGRWLRRSDAGWVSAEVSPGAAGIIRQETLRGQRANWIAVGGTASALTIDPVPAFPAAADTAGVPLRLAMPLAAVAGGTTLRYNAALPALPILWADGAAIGADDWAAGEVVGLIGTGAAFVIAGISPRRLYKETRRSRQQVFFGSGTFVVPPNVYEIEGECIGGGSGAWGAWGGLQLGGGGGGGGGRARKIIAVTPGQSIAITVGGGGAGAAPGDTPTAGGTSSVGPYCSATGGSINPSSSGTNPVNGNFGGNGVGGDENFAGSSGDNAAMGYDGYLAFGGNGAGAAGGGGTQQTSFAGAGNGGISPGGGGSGGSSVSGVGYSGGSGAPGRVVIRW